MKTTVLDRMMEATIQTKKKEEEEGRSRLELAGGEEGHSLLDTLGIKKEVSILRRSQVRKRFP